MRSCDFIECGKVAENKMYFFTSKKCESLFHGMKAKLRVPLPFVSDRSIHSDDNMMHPAENVLSMPAGNKFRKP